MTVLPDVIDAFVELVSAAAPRGVQISAEPPAEGAKRTTIYIEECESTFNWQCLGSPADQEERIRLRFVVAFYDESIRQMNSSRGARAGAVGLLEAVQRGVMGGDRPHQLQGTVSWGRVAAWRLRLTGTEKGWVATGRGVLDATYYP